MRASGLGSGKPLPVEEEKLKGKLTKWAAAGVLSIGTAASGLAGSVTQPGETLGVPTGAPAPPGFYFANTANWGCRNTNPQRTCVGVNIPVLVWSTPAMIFGARLQLSLAPTTGVEVGIHNTTYFSGLFNPFTSAQLAWDLGNGWGFSYLLGAYFDINSPVAYSSSSLNQRFALSYTGNGWDLTANAVWGSQFDHVTGNPQTSPCPVSLAFPANGCNPNFINFDLTATKKFGKWELGPVGFYSSDLSVPVPGYRKQSQFAVGGLIGYWFDRAIVQVIVTSDVYEKNYGGNDIRGWARIVFPLGNPNGPQPAPTPITY
jgi:Putative MetA-pathway of phenol degradation